MNRAELARFTRMYVVSETGCWEWIGLLSKNGYGRHRVGPGHPLVAAHRLSYEHHKGAIPDGMQVDHLCRNRRCVRPDHLEAVSPSVNTDRQDHANRRKTHCPNGHPYDDENTVIGADGWRRCRTCRSGATSPS
jgi:HNH endonuclease